MAEWGSRHFDEGLSWLEEGSGEPLILIHGGLSSAADDWSILGPLWARRGRRVIAPDLPCHGQSDGDIATLSHLGMYRSVRRLVDRLALAAPYDVVGWSLGACLALHWLDEDPKSLNSLVLISTNLFPDSQSRRSALQLDATRIRQRPELLRRLSAWRIGEQWPALTSRLSQLWEESPNFPTSILADCPGRPLLAVGDRDHLIGHEQLLDATRTNANADLIVLPNVGHFVPHDPRAATLLLQAVSGVE